MFIHKRLKSGNRVRYILYLLSCKKLYANNTEVKITRKQIKILTKNLGIVMII